MPHGPIMVPLLFIIYLNDLRKSIPWAHLHPTIKLSSSKKIEFMYCPMGPSWGHLYSLSILTIFRSQYLELICTLQLNFAIWVLSLWAKNPMMWRNDNQSHLIFIFNLKRGMLVVKVFSENIMCPWRWSILWKKTRNLPSSHSVIRGFHVLFCCLELPGGGSHQDLTHHATAIDPFGWHHHNQSDRSATC